MKAYCAECDTDREFEVLEQVVESTIGQFTFKYLAQIPYCKSCGNEVYIAEMNDHNLKLATDQYRKLSREK
ncbi:hypothetical protein SDC9_153300 [bioreactor metagenome]|uniref:YgiT-type zinc finger domain-containing protein n=1 Tax=bioreactor metagenome TaxID=1076179 RepID=A0A645EXA4_9ZZZZ